MSKLVEEIDNRGWAETREDASGKSVSMRVLPWGDYVALTSAVDALMGVGRSANTIMVTAPQYDADGVPDWLDALLGNLSLHIMALTPELKEAMK